MILYTVRDAAREDLAGTLARVRESGFEHVQWSGMPALPAEAVRRHLDKAGLTAIAGHTALDPFEADFDAAVSFWRTVGVSDVAVGSMMPECRDTREGWLAGAGRLDAVGALLREAGMRLSYHNHAFEFEDFGDGVRKLDLLYASTRPDALYAELDTAWVYAGGGDPAAYLRRYAGRCPILHVKDLAPGRDPDGGYRFAPLGRGVLDWGAIFAAARDAGVEWCVYEQDTCEGDVFACVRESLAFLAENLD